MLEFLHSTLRMVFLIKLEMDILVQSEHRINSNLEISNLIHLKIKFRWGYDGRVINLFSPTKILFATGNLTDLVVFQTDQSIRQMVANFEGACVDYSSGNPYPANYCTPRFYPLATNPSVQGAVGAQVAYITGQSLDGNNNRKKAPGIDF